MAALGANNVNDTNSTTSATNTTMSIARPDPTAALRSQAEFFMSGVVPVGAQLGDCSVCTESLNSDVVTILACNHSFHMTCILQWFQSDPVRRGSCPNCRRELFEPERLRAPTTEGVLTDAFNNARDEARDARVATMRRARAEFHEAMEIDLGRATAPNTNASGHVRHDPPVSSLPGHPRRIPEHGRYNPSAYHNQEHVSYGRSTPRVHMPSQFMALREHGQHDPSGSRNQLHRDYNPFPPPPQPMRLDPSGHSNRRPSDSMAVQEHERHYGPSAPRVQMPLTRSAGVLPSRNTPR
ncbi:hypothetical protein CC86DRAFT_425925 [Ophiobolus disseminans]|uniref:RING-type domain-containing protein n=1 Tax=Ophiobolus disseminans TaxID=1469910 RepID=A0A6A6ZPS2_9PLEO|nr:hypothetical protein CC86DRAFT_425925 [Ophiobolus disseminans]